MGRKTPVKKDALLDGAPEFTSNGKLRVSRACTLTQLIASLLR